MPTMLATERCVACHRDAPRVTPEEIDELKPLIPEWNLTDVDGVPRLERTFKVANFLEALAFTKRVGLLAEEEGHHPVLVTEWGRVTVIWFTKKIRGLHRNDFIMAARTDALARSQADAARD
ncbi:MAG: 4a-hydroxytetrahydrobiopterin dehydratase [Thermomicrobiales bacterium]